MIMVLPTMYRDTQNTDTPNLPFAQTSYSLRGGTIKYPTPTPTPTGGVPRTPDGYSRSQIEKIIEDYHGDDISLLHSHAVNFGKSLSSAQLHRDSIEGKVETGITARKDIHTKLSNLGSSVSDISYGLEAHKLTPHVNIGNPFDFQQYLPYVLIGGVALLAMRKK